MSRKNSKLTTTALAALVPLVGGLLFSTSALAATTTGADDKSWTGAVCSPAGGNPWGAVKIIPTGIINSSDTARYIACPLTVDSEVVWNTADNNGGVDTGNADLYLSFSFADAASATVTCTAQIIDEDTNTIIETASNSVAGTAGDATVYLNITNLLQGTGDGHAAAFNCLLPPQVRLNVINLEEYSETSQTTVY